MATTNKPTMVCAPPAHAGANGQRNGVTAGVLYCDTCGGECGTMLDAGFDPRLHGMRVVHAACAMHEVPVE